MTITAKMIDEMRLYGNTSIDENLEALLLQQYGTEPFPHTYTEQDLHEQIRKSITQYNRDHAATTNLSEAAVTRPSKSTEQKGGLCP